MKKLIYLGLGAVVLGGAYWLFFVKNKSAVAPVTSDKPIVGGQNPNNRPLQDRIVNKSATPDSMQQSQKVNITAPLRNTTVEGNY